MYKYTDKFTDRCNKGVFLKVLKDKLITSFTAEDETEGK